MTFSSEAEDSIWFIIALATLLISIISSLFAFKNEQNRRLRCELRKLLKQRLADMPEVAEREFAHIITAAMRQRDFQKLKKLKVEKYISEYIGDLEFQPKLLHLLRSEVPKNSLLDEQVLAETLKAIDSWRVSKQLVERDILSYLQQIATREGPHRSEVKKIKSFVESRHKDYFETKTNEFVEDVKQVVSVACGHG
jgi:hypothetical protein